MVTPTRHGRRICPFPESSARPVHAETSLRCCHPACLPRALTENLARRMAVFCGRPRWKIKRNYGNSLPAPLDASRASLLDASASTKRCDTHSVLAPVEPAVPVIRPGTLCVGRVPSPWNTGAHGSRKWPRCQRNGVLSNCSLVAEFFSWDFKTCFTVCLTANHQH